MKKLLPLLAAVSLAFAFGSCATKTPLKTNYTPPSTTEVRQSVTTAQEKTTSIGKHADKSSKSVAEAAAGAKTAQDRIVLLLQATKDQPTIQEMVRLVGNDLTAITLNLATAKDEIAGLQLDVQSLQSTLNGAQAQIVQLTTDVGKQTTLLNKANENANAAIAQSAIDTANAHKFKAIIIISVVLALGAVLFGVFRFAVFAPPLLYVLIGLPTVVGIVLFFWLGS
jgi:hypothetical protein